MTEWPLWLKNLFPLSGSNSAVECNLAKVEVAGSNPVSRSTFRPWAKLMIFFGWLALAATPKAGNKDDMAVQGRGPVSRQSENRKAA